MREPKQAEKRGAAVATAALLLWYDRALDLIDRISSVVIITAMAVMTVVIIAQVFFRYALNSSLDWGEELPRLCFVFVILLAIPLGIKRGAHVGIDLLASRLAARWNRIIYRMNLLLIIALMCIAAYYAVIMARDTWDQMLFTLPISTGVFYVGVIICAVHSVMHLLRLVWFGRPAADMYDDQ